MDEAQFQALFGQSMAVFLQGSQEVLRTLCEACVTDFDKGWTNHLSLFPFDPHVIHSGSRDCLTDNLVGTVSVLSFGDLCSGDDSGVIVHQYREVTSHFKRRWSANTPAEPVVDDDMSLWLSYPLSDRCLELFERVQIPRLTCQLRRHWTYCS